MHLELRVAEARRLADLSSGAGQLRIEPQGLDTLTLLRRVRESARTLRHVERERPRDLERRLVEARERPPRVDRLERRVDVRHGHVESASFVLTYADGLVAPASSAHGSRADLSLGRLRGKAYLVDGSFSPFDLSVTMIEKGEPRVSFGRSPPSRVDLAHRREVSEASSSRGSSCRRAEPSRAREPSGSVIVAYLRGDGFVGRQKTVASRAP